MKTDALTLSSWSLMLLVATSACGGATVSGAASGDTGLGHSSDAVTSGKCPRGATVLGIDVSSYQGNVNWGAVRGSGVQFAIARVSDGFYRDGYFDQNWSGMKAAGLIRGAYQFFEPGSDPVGQANLVIGKVGRLGAGDLPVMLDVEVTNGLSGSQITASIHRWVDAITAGTGKVPFIYSGAYFWDDHVGSGDFAGLALDVAWYGTNCPGTPNAWSNWTFHQFTDAQRVNGVSGGVDADVFNGDLAALQAFAGTAAEPCAGVANGDYCGGTHGMSGDPSTLYTCASGKQSELSRCTLCQSTPGGDFCLEPHRLATAPDVDGDNKADLCARSSIGISCWLSSGNGFPTQLAGPPLSNASGWTRPQYYTTVLTGDVNGDGKADVCARGGAGVTCWLSNGTGFPTTIQGPPLSDASGWALPQYYSTLQLADINGDGKADFCGRSSAGLDCWLSNGSGFPTLVSGPPLSDAAGWASPTYYSSIQLADINGDGKADVCARGIAGVFCWLSNGTGFPTQVTGPALADAQGWNQAEYLTTLQMADINGDGKADLCGRAAAGFFCWLSNGTGFPTQVTGPALSNAQGWSLPAYYTTIQMADVNGDGKADVCGRGVAGVFCWLSNGTGFPTQVTGPALSDASGWGAPAYYTTIQLADIDGDGKADVCARSSAGIDCWHSTGSGFSAQVAGPALSDAADWEHPMYLQTLHLVGGLQRPPPTLTPPPSPGPGGNPTPPPTGNPGPSGNPGGSKSGGNGATSSAKVQGCSAAGSPSGGLDAWACLQVLGACALRARVVFRRRAKR